MTNATTAGAVAAYLGVQGAGFPVYRDRPPPGTALPYVTVQEGIAAPFAHITTEFDKSLTLQVAEMVQVDLWQTWQNADDTTAEAYADWTNILKILAGSRLGGLLATNVYGVRFVGRVRLPDLESNTVHDALTFIIDHDL